MGGIQGCVLWDCLVLSSILVPQIATRTRVLVCHWSSESLTWEHPGLG